MSGKYRPPPSRRTMKKRTKRARSMKNAHKKQEVFQPEGEIFQDLLQVQEEIVTDRSTEVEVPSVSFPQKDYSVGNIEDQQPTCSRYLNNSPQNETWLAGKLQEISPSEKEKYNFFDSTLLDDVAHLSATIMDTVDLTAEQPSKCYGTIDISGDDNDGNLGRDLDSEPTSSFCWICLRIVSESIKLDKKWRKLMSTLTNNFTPSCKLASEAAFCVNCYKDFALNFKYFFDFQDRINMVEKYFKVYANKNVTQREMNCLRNLISSNVLSVNLTSLDQITNSLEDIEKQIKGSKVLCNSNECLRVEGPKKEAIHSQQSVDDILKHKIDMFKLGSTTIISKNKIHDSTANTEFDCKEGDDLGFKISGCFTVKDDTKDQKFASNAKSIDITSGSSAILMDIKNASNAISIDSIAEEFYDDNLLPADAKCGTKEDKVITLSDDENTPRDQSPPFKGFPEEPLKYFKDPNSQPKSTANTVAQKRKRSSNNPSNSKRPTKKKKNNKSSLPITNKIEGKNVDVVQNVFIMSKPTINNYQKYVKQSNSCEDQSSKANRKNRSINEEEESEANRNSIEQLQESDAHKPSDVLKTFIDSFVEDELKHSDTHAFIENSASESILLDEDSEEELIIL